MTSIRAATLADAPALAAIFITAWRTGYTNVVPAHVIDALDQEELTKTLGERISDRQLQTAVAVDDEDTPLGYATFGPDAQHPGCGYLPSLYVHPDAAGHGIGRSLLSHVLEVLSGMDVWLWVFEKNERARRLYERLGFRPGGNRVTEPQWQSAQVDYCRPTTNAQVPGREVSVPPSIGS
jgi:ribosomal protein S18 acetylase RimI-like enzyme